MFKVTPFFPLRSKDKHTTTVDNIGSNHNYWMKSTGNYFSNNMFLNKPSSDFQRILQLSQPRKKHLSKANLLSTESSFLHHNKSLIGFTTS